MYSILWKVGRMAGEFTELFTELLFGTGSWIGLIIILVLMVIALASWKWSGILCLPISLMLGIEYFLHALGWQGIVMWLFAVFCLLRLAGIMGDD